MYQAIEPKIALEIILKRYMEAKKDALIELENFKNQEILQNLILLYGSFLVLKVLNLRLKKMLKNAQRKYLLPDIC